MSCPQVGKTFLSQGDRELRRVSAPPSHRRGVLWDWGDIGTAPSPSCHLPLQTMDLGSSPAPRAFWESTMAQGGQSQQFHVQESIPMDTLTAGAWRLGS